MVSRLRRGEGSQQLEAKLRQALQEINEANDKQLKEIKDTQDREAALGLANREARMWKEDFSLFDVIQAGLLASGAADLFSRLDETAGTGFLTEKTIYDVMGNCTADLLAKGYDEDMAKYATLFSFLYAWVAMSMFLVIRRQNAIEDQKLSERESSVTDGIWRTMHAIMTFLTLHAVSTTSLGQGALEFAADNLAMTGTIQENMTKAATMISILYAMPFLARQMLSRIPFLAGLNDAIQLLDLVRVVGASGARFYIDTITGRSRQRLTAPGKKTSARVGAPPAHGRRRVDITVGGYSFDPLAAFI